MTDCPDGELRDLLPDLMHDRLDAPRRREVELHLARCASCRAELALLGGLRGALRRAPVHVDAVVAALPAYRPTPRRAWSPWRAAAAIAAVTVGGISVAVAWQGSGIPDPIAPATAVVRGGGDTVAGDRTPPLVVAAAPPSRAGRLPVAAPRELPLRDGFADLTETELAALLSELESLDALPSMEVDTTALVPASALPAPRGAS